MLFYLFTTFIYVNNSAAWAKTPIKEFIVYRYRNCSISLVLSSALALTHVYVCVRVWEDHRKNVLALVLAS